MCVRVQGKTKQTLQAYKHIYCLQICTDVCVIGSVLYVVLFKISGEFPQTHVTCSKVTE